LFDILDRPLHWITVKWPGLSQQGGDENALSVPVEHEVELRVELVDRDEVQDIFPKMFRGEDATVMDPTVLAKADELIAADPSLARDSAIEIAAFLRITKGWRKIKAGGRVPEFNVENVRLLLKVPMFGPAFTGAYVAALGGKAAIREGNLSDSPANGPADGSSKASTTSSPAIAPASE